MLEAVTLQNEIIRLSPLQPGDWKKLLPLNKEASLWTAFPVDLTDDQAFENWMESRIKLREEGQLLPFLVTHLGENRPVGLTCYMNIDEPNLGLEIGSTWYGAPYHGTAVNPNCKLLLMTHAFETLGYHRVELKTDALNLRSRKAIEKLGAKQDGILRSNRIVQNGRRRDTVYYSILRDEWPEVKVRLQERIATYR